MASVAVTTIDAMSHLVAATNVTSADSSYTVSGIKNDEELVIVFVNGASSSIVPAILAGDYCNADQADTTTSATTLTTIAQSTVRVIDGIDGSKYRWIDDDKDGKVTINFTLTGTGNCNIYAFTK